MILNNKMGVCPCDFLFSHCDLSTNKCACDAGFVMTTDLRRCIASTVHLDQPCEMNEQCVRFDAHSTCNEGICDCLKNFTLHENTCRFQVKISEHCESNEECRKFTENAVCIDHKCACEENFVASDDGNVSFDVLILTCF